MSQKEEKIDSVARAVCGILLQKGFAGLSFSTVARSAGVSRAWLYKYIGSSKEDLVEFAVDYFGKAFARLDVGGHLGEDLKTWIQNRLISMDGILDDCVEKPWLMPLYFRFRDTKTPLGERITRIESLHLRKAVDEIKRLFNKDTQEAQLIAELFLSLRLGIAYRWGALGMHERMQKSEVMDYLSRWLKQSTKQ